jgi:hypothetical protein
MCDKIVAPFLIFYRKKPFIVLGREHTRETLGELNASMSDSYLP